MDGVTLKTDAQSGIKFVEIQLTGGLLGAEDNGTKIIRFDAKEIDGRLIWPTLRLTEDRIKLLEIIVSYAKTGSKPSFETTDEWRAELERIQSGGGRVDTEANDAGAVRVVRKEPSMNGFSFKTDAEWAGEFKGVQLTGGFVETGASGSKVARFDPKEINGRLAYPAFRVTEDRADLMAAVTAYEKMCTILRGHDENRIVIVISTRATGGARLYWEGDLRISDDDFLRQCRKLISEAVGLDQEPTDEMLLARLHLSRMIWDQEHLPVEERASCPRSEKVMEDDDKAKRGEN